MEKSNRRIRVKLTEVLHKRGLTQQTLAEMSGVRQAAISEISRNIRDSVNLRYLEKIAQALEIDDITELIEIRRNDRIDS